MRRVLAILLAAVMLFVTGVFALATGGSLSKDHVYPGDAVSVYGFYTSDGDPLPEGDLDSDYYTVSASWRRGGAYVSRVYIDDESRDVKILIKSGAPATTEKAIEGSVTVREIDSSERRRYTAEVSMILGGGGTIQMVEVDVDSFELPDEYQSKKIRFVTENGNKIGTLRADFHSSDYASVAYFNVRVIEQGPLFLGHNNAPDLNLRKKYNKADLRFLAWGGEPTFDVTGTLGIYCSAADYVYSRQADGTLQRLDGRYNHGTGAYEIRTKTLGSYVISDQALPTGPASEASSSSSSSSASSSSVASSSSSSSTPSTPPPSSSSASVARPSSSSSSSSVTPPPSSSSSSEVPVIGVPEISQEPSGEESSSESIIVDESSTPVALPQETPQASGGFPLVPVVVGGLLVVVITLAVVLMSGRGRSSDDWDD